MEGAGGLSPLRLVGNSGVLTATWPTVTVYM